MTKPKLSVVLGTYQRAKLLERSLVCYAYQLPREDFELIVLDDWSSDQTQQVCEVFAKEINLVYIKPTWKEPGTWRDSASILNLGLRAARGELIIATHPEVMPGPKTLLRLWEAYASQRHSRTYYCSKPYYLTEDQQDVIDTLPWVTKGALTVRDLPDFYKAVPVIAGNPDYSPPAIDASPSWDSWVFGGLPRWLWKEIGGLGEYNSWGSVDLDFDQRRRVLGIANHSLQDRDAYCVHQNHNGRHANNAPTPRDMVKAHAPVPTYTRQSAVLDNL